MPRDLATIPDVHIVYAFVLYVELSQDGQMVRYVVNILTNGATND